MGEITATDDKLDDASLEAIRLEETAEEIAEEMAEAISEDTALDILLDKLELCATLLGSDDAGKDEDATDDGATDDTDSAEEASIEDPIADPIEDTPSELEDEAIGTTATLEILPSLDRLLAGATLTALDCNELDGNELLNAGMLLDTATLESTL